MRLLDRLRAGDEGAATVAAPHDDRPRSALERAVAAVPLLVVSTILLDTGAEILPRDAIVSAGPVELNLARLLILAGLAAVLYADGARRELFGTRLAIPIALLLVAALVSSVKWGTEPRLRFLVESVALFYLTVAVVRSRPPARAALLTVALVALSLAALPGVAQVSQEQATGFYRQGCVPVTAAPPRIPPDTVTRARGSFENPNLLGAHVLLLAPLAGLAAASASGLAAAALGLAVALSYLALAFTYSRAAVFMALIGLGVALATSGLRNRGYLAVVGVLLALGSLSLFGSCGSEATAGYGRTQIWRDTVDVIQENPVYGVGLGRLGDVLRARDERSVSRHAHNLFLNWAGEAGPAALLAWVWIFGALIWWSFRRALRGDGLARAALVALIGFLGISMLDHPANVDRIASAFWVVAGVAAGVAALPRPRRALSAPAPTAPGASPTELEAAPATRPGAPGA